MASRINLSLPEALRKRMEEIQEVNWSRVAVAAFEQKLAEIASIKKNMTTQDVILRLKASKRKGAPKDFKNGVDAGKKWACNYAEWVELERLAMKPDDDEPGESKKPALLLRDAIDPKNELLLEELQDFFERHLGTKAPSEDAILGFCEGAVEVYKEVKGKV